MRSKMIDADVIEAVIGLGPNLFYNSPMEACIIICRAMKPGSHRGKVLFIDALDEVTRERAQSSLTPEHIKRIVDAYRAFKDEEGFAAVAAISEIKANDDNLSIPLFVNRTSSDVVAMNLPAAISGWRDSSTMLSGAAVALFDLLDGDEVLR
jgi:type I restriction enzyme M protein